MASSETLHPYDCGCSDCQHKRFIQSDVPENPYKNVTTMPRTRKDYYDDDAYETASDSDSDRARKDQIIRQAPYLPRIQVWARDDGPYTLRIGHQWFHCDDLMINGVEFRQVSKKPVVHQQRHQAQSANPSVYPPGRPRRPAVSRAQSYTRTRPQTTQTSTPPSTPRSSGEKIAAQNQYQPYPLPTPNDRGKANKQRDAQYRQERRDSGVSVSGDVEAQNVQLVPYQQTQPRPSARPALDRRSSRQGAMRQAMRSRPGFVRRGSSFEVPVRSKGRKSVRFAPLPLPT